MKKIYSLIFASVFALLSLNVSATTHTVQVSNFAFTPNAFSANIGDTVKWVWVSGTHTVQSLAVPAGAATFSSSTLSSAGANFIYVIAVAGNYGYDCGIHGTSMPGGFTVAAATGIAVEPTVNLLTNAYPNPFEDKITVKYNGIQLIEVFNVVGENIKTIALSGNDTKVEIDFTGLPTGMYFYRTYKDGAVVETKRIIKAK